MVESIVCPHCGKDWTIQSQRMEWDTAMDDWECIGDNGCGLFAEVRKWRASSPMIDVLRRHIESAETLPY